MARASDALRPDHQCRRWLSVCLRLLDRRLSSYFSRARQVAAPAHAALTEILILSAAAARPTEQSSTYSRSQAGWRPANRGGPRPSAPVPASACRLAPTTTHSDCHREAIRRTHRKRAQTASLQLTNGGRRDRFAVPLHA